MDYAWEQFRGRDFFSGNNFTMRDTTQSSFIGIWNWKKNPLKIVTEFRSISADLFIAQNNDNLCFNQHKYVSRRQPANKEFPLASAFLTDNHLFFDFWRKTNENKSRTFALGRIIKLVSSSNVDWHADIRLGNFSFNQHLLSSSSSPSWSWASFFFLVS